jgi:DNA (cytosine-5)-methyltransferase 1
MIIHSAEESIKYKQLNSGIIVPAQYKKYPTCFDFFAGCGGFSLGFIKAGFEVVGALEIDPSAAHTYMTNLCSHPVQIHYTSEKYQKILEDYFEKAFKNHLKEKRKQLYKGAHQRGGLIESENIFLSDFISGSGYINGRGLPPVRNFFFGDIKEVSGEWILERLGMEKGELDVVIGGPPCQGFSKANRNNKSSFDVRNYLVFEFARKVVELYPKTFVMEEVPDILDYVTPDGMPVIDALLMILEDGGFGKQEALKNMLLSTSGVGLAKRNPAFRTTKNNQVKKKDKISEAKKKKLKNIVKVLKQNKV